MATLSSWTGSSPITSDPGELTRLLAAKRAENDQLVAAYRDHIEAVQRDLAHVERDFEGE